ncbi:MAG: acyl-ACP thioesterase [Pseudomonadota bacterium]
MAFERCYQGSVNRWECDENDHLNVRFYLHKAHQALTAFALRHGVTATPGHHWLDGLRAHHIRYLREARMATPITGECAIADSDAPTPTLLTRLYHSETGVTLATFVSEFGTQALPPQNLDQLRAQATHPLTPEFGSRGVTARTSPYASLTAAAAAQAGYRAIGAGIIGPEECDERGRMSPWHYMGRTSDSMPNFWARLRGGGGGAEDSGAEDSAGEDDAYLGGAVLEYRMQFHEPLYCGQGYEHLGAIGEIGNKTQQIAHLIYSVPSGALAVSAEALGISLDLKTRKSIPIRAEHRERMQAFQRGPLPA